MKKIASLIIAAVAVVACSSPSVFIVKGERADLQGTVSMVSAGDTLAKAEIVNGAFTLKVPAEVQTVGRICINGKKIADGVMVEPGNAVVEFAESGKAYVTGTASNDIMANYFKTDDELYLQYKKAQTDEERMAIRTKMGENTLNGTAGDLIGLYQFTQDKYEFNAEQLEAAIMELSPVFGESPVIKVARKDLEVIRATEIGQPFMNFSQAGPDGEMIEFASTVGEGKYVLLDFWASWCGPCMAELPYLLESYEKYHSKGFEIFGVSLDSDRQSWLNCIKNNKMNWIHTSDVKYWSNEVAVMYAIHSIPSNFLIDPEGKIIAKNLRGKALELKLQSLLD